MVLYYHRGIRTIGAIDCCLEIDQHSWKALHLVYAGSYFSLVGVHYYYSDQLYFVIKFTVIHDSSYNSIEVM